AVHCNPMISDKELLPRKGGAVALLGQVRSIPLQQRMDRRYSISVGRPGRKLPDQFDGIGLRQSFALQLRNYVFDKVNHHALCTSCSISRFKPWPPYTSVFKA